MSFSHLAYDSCAYAAELKESEAVGKYLIDPVFSGETHERCFVPWTNAAPSENAVAVSSKYPLIDVDSELLGITRKYGRCRTEPDDSYAENAPLKDCSDPFLDPENTKLSNPPCTLRGTGWNRWEWLCTNPQDTAILPFRTNIDNKLLARDNHRPCLPTPLSNNEAHPPNSADSAKCYTDHPAKFEGVDFVDDVSPTYMHWRPCCEIALL